MTVIRTHDFEGGTAGAAIAVGDGSGFDVVGGTVDYIAGGYSGQGAEFTTGTNYVQDNVAPGYYGARWKAPTLTGLDATIDRVTDSGGSTVCACTLDSAGKLHLWSGLSTDVVDSTVAVTAGQWFRLERQALATGQALKIFLNPTSQTPDETINGTTSGGTPGKLLYGFGWAAHSTGTLDVDGITVADAWPDLGTPASTGAHVRGVIIGGVEVAATLRGVIAGGVEVAATIKQVISAAGGGGGSSSALYPSTSLYPSATTYPQGA